MDAEQLERFFEGSESSKGMTSLPSCVARVRKLEKSWKLYTTYLHKGLKENDIKILMMIIKKKNNYIII